MKKNLPTTCEISNDGSWKCRLRFHWMGSSLRNATLVGLAFLTVCTAVHAGTVQSDIPSVVDQNAKYLFYMHGHAIEQGGPRARSYQYSSILKEIAERGFVVIGEERSPVKNDVYASKVADQVRRLLAAGVPARNITVAGHSKGGMIAMLVMSILANPNIAYVNFAGCIKGVSESQGYLRFAEHRAPRARGHLLSAYDRSDEVAGSCKQALDRMKGAVVVERVLEIGGGHELFYSPKAQWLDVLQSWAERRGQ
jgi:hypothetical protein